MEFKEIENLLIQRFPLLQEKARQSHEVSRTITQIVLGNSHEQHKSHEEVLEMIKPYPPELFLESFPMREYASDPIKKRFIQDIRNIGWKGVGYGEILFEMMASISEKTNKYNIKNLKTAVSLNPLKPAERNGDKLLKEYFDGNAPGNEKTHLTAVNMAKNKDVTPFFEKLYPKWPDCRTWSDLLKSGVDAYTFRQTLGVRIHQEDAKIYGSVGYIFSTDDGFMHILTKDISVDLCSKYGLQYSLHFKRGNDTQSNSDGYAKVTYSKKNNKSVKENMFISWQSL